VEVGNQDKSIQFLEYGAKVYGRISEYFANLMKLAFALKTEKSLQFLEYRAKVYG
jgi:hypothetical protein